MEIKHFRLIRSIAEEGSIANSSEKLFLTQSALSHQLRIVEERLGFKIFLRSRNRWTLTDQGKELYNLSKTILDTIDQGIKDIDAINEKSKGTIRICTECSSFYIGLPKFIEKMAVLYPKVNVQLVHDIPYKPISNILSNNAEIALVSTPPKSKNLTSIELYKEEVFAIMHKEHPLADQKYLLGSDIIKTHILIHSYPLESVYVYQHFLKPQNLEPPNISSIPMSEIALEMIQANMGVMYISKRTLSLLNYSKELRCKQIGEEGLIRTLYLVYKTKDAHKKHISDFVSFIKENFEEEEMMVN